MRDAINDEDEGDDFFCESWLWRCVVVTWIPSEEDRLSQEKKAGPVEAVVEEEETLCKCKACWGKDQIGIVGVQHVVDVGGDGDDVKDGDDVEDSHSLPCNPPIHWNVTSAAEGVSSTTFDLLMTWISVFSSRICVLCFFIFLNNFFWIHRHLPHMVWRKYWVLPFINCWIKVSNESVTGSSNELSNTIVWEDRIVECDHGGFKHCNRYNGGFEYFSTNYSSKK